MEIEKFNVTAANTHKRKTTDLKNVTYLLNQRQISDSEVCVKNVGIDFITEQSIILLYKYAK